MEICAYHTGGSQRLQSPSFELFEGYSSSLWLISMSQSVNTVRTFLFCVQWFFGNYKL